MQNGRPGDHPYTDIVTHGFNVFGDEVDIKIRALADGARPELENFLSALVGNWPRVDYKPVNVDDLSFVLDLLKQYAEAADGS